MTEPRQPWTRPPPERPGPHRSAGGYYRAAPGESGTGAFYGVPLQTAEDTAVSAVRAAYRVVDAQMERGARIARSLREASVRQGAGEPAEALDAGERLARKALLAGVEWLETLVAEPGSPVKRVLAAEYRWIGAALGIVSPEGPPESRAAPASASAQREEPDFPLRYAGAPVGPMVKIRHEKGSAFRAVSIVAWQLEADLPADGTLLRFFNADKPWAAMIEGTLKIEAGVPVMQLSTLDNHASGRWKSSLCNAENIQFGIVEIEL